MSIILCLKTIKGNLSESSTKPHRKKLDDCVVMFGYISFQIESLIFFKEIFRPLFDLVDASLITTPIFQRIFHVLITMPTKTHIIP